MSSKQPDVRDNQSLSSPLQMSTTSWLRRSSKLGNVAMQGIYATRRFLDAEITAPEAGSVLPSLVAPEDSHASSLRKIDKLRNMARRSHEVLVSVNTVFPLTLFVDTVIVDRTKVTIIYRTFFFTSRTISVRVGDILNVTCSVGPFFGSVLISSRIMNSTDHFVVDKLWRYDAIMLKHVIQGYMIAMHNDVDLTHLSREELFEHLSELGHESDK